ncbi:hypothetical protein ABBQ38_000672 [Trebouxia sp. C0009 RCD-2024]
MVSPHVEAWTAYAHSIRRSSSGRDVSEGVVQKLLQLKQALDQGDFNKASIIQVSLTTSDWDECSTWLSALKRLIKVNRSARDRAVGWQSALASRVDAAACSNASH